jgi:hypothetical protein
MAAAHRLEPDLEKVVAQYASTLAARIDRGEIEGLPS